jgi:hypothetical protein
MKSEPAKQYQDKDDKEQKADAAVQPVAESVSRATTKSTETAQQKYHENDQ